MSVQAPSNYTASFKLSHSKANPWSTLGHSIISNSTISSFEKTLANQSGGHESPAKRGMDSRRSRPTFTRGVGLTPRLFEVLLHSDLAPIEALPSAYIPTISRHVESVGPSKQVFSQYWCPVVVEDERGERHVLHVDPIVIRKFRRTIAKELQHVREKRERMLGRINTIRQDFPQIQARDAILRLQSEIAEAKNRKDEILLQPLSEEIQVLHIFLDATSHMIQLELVCQYLLRELPSVLGNSSVQRISLTALRAGLASDNVDNIPTLAPFDWKNSDSWKVACEWLASLQPQLAVDKQTKKQKSCAVSGGVSLERALRWASTCDAFDNGKSMILLLACSEPVDIDACIGLARRSNALLHIIGVFGLSPDDPEAGLQRLADAAIAGSSLRMFFGSTYWNQFVAVRERQLQQAEQSEWGVEAASTFIGNQTDNEIVSGKMLEMRLIERIMRECYSEEQQCEEELTCATRVFERTLVDSEEITAVLRDRGKSSRNSGSHVALATSR